MLTYVQEDITKSDCFAIVHGCNCQGKMASGVAKDIRAAFPEAYLEYMKWVHKSALGGMITAKSNNKLIGNLLTQQYYGHDGKVYANRDAIKVALDSFVFYYRGLFINHPLYGPDDKLSPIAMPKIGCGLGGLKWDDVRPIVEEISEYHKVDFIIYEKPVENWK